MYVALVFVVAILWSLVGVFVKMASTMLDSATITFLRFAIGVLFLLALLWWKKGKLRIRGKERWVWFGAVGKSANYFFENIGIALGLSYGYIIGSPVGTIVVLLVMVFAFRESISRIEWLAALVCLIGVFFVNWNGNSLDEMVSEHGAVTLLFVLSGIGYAFHVLSQKKLVQSMDAITMNVSVFFWSALITALPLPFQFEFKGTVSVSAVVSVLLLGAITGISFYMFSTALKHVPFFVAVIVSNSSVMFTVLWGWLFFKEPVSIYVVIGVLLFVAGMVTVNWPKGKARAVPVQASATGERSRGE